MLQSVLEASFKCYRNVAIMEANTKEEKTGESFSHQTEIFSIVSCGNKNLGDRLLVLLLGAKQYLIRQVWRALQSSNLI